MIQILILLCSTFQAFGDLVTYEIIPGDGVDSEIRAYKMEYMTPFGYIRGSNRWDLAEIRELKLVQIFILKHWIKKTLLKQ